MPPSKSVVSNTSPLLNLALIDRLELLERQFDTVTVPEQVWEELLEGEDGIERLKTFRDRGVLEVTAVDESELFVEFRRTLDYGEAAALTHTIETDAELILLDEREARAAAKRHDLSVTGIIGVLLRGTESGVVDIQTELDALRAAGFWISEELYELAIQRAAPTD